MVYRSCWHVIVPSRPHQREDCSTVLLLDITHSASLQLPPSFFSFCHSASSHSLSRSLSPSLCIWITPPLSLRMPPRSEVLSHLLHPSCVCLSLVPFFFSPATSHPITSPTLEFSSQLKPLYLCLSGLVFSLSPLLWSPFVFLGLFAFLLSSFSRLFLIFPS